MLRKVYNEGSGSVVVASGNQRVISELRKRKIEGPPLALDGPISTGGGMRCAHHPLHRSSRFKN